MERPSDYNEDTMWGMETGADCDCPGPPPEFMLPPPPRPPFLQPQDPLHCTEDPLPIETCDALPVSFFFKQIFLSHYYWDTFVKNLRNFLI